MPLASYSSLVAGVAQVWGSAGVPGVTKLLTLETLAINAAQQGVKSATWLDANGTLPELLEIYLQLALAAGGTGEAELFFGESSDAIAANRNPGGLTGANEAYLNPDEKKGQLIEVGRLPFAASLAAGIQSKQIKYRGLIGPYIIPVVINKATQAFHGTNTNFLLTITPYYRKVMPVS